MEGGPGRQRSSEKQSRARGCISKVFSSSKAAGAAAAPAAAAPAAAAGAALPAGDVEDLLPIHGLDLPAGLVGARGQGKLPGSAAAAAQGAGEWQGPWHASLRARSVLAYLRDHTAPNTVLLYQCSAQLASRTGCCALQASTILPPAHRAPLELVIFCAGSSDLSHAYLCAAISGQD